MENATSNVTDSGSAPLLGGALAEGLTISLTLLGLAIALNVALVCAAAGVWACARASLVGMSRRSDATTDARSAAFSDTRLRNALVLWLLPFWTTLVSIANNAWSAVTLAGSLAYSRLGLLLALALLWPLDLVLDTYGPTILTAVQQAWSCWGGPLIRPQVLPIVNAAGLLLDSITPYTNFLGVQSVRSLVLFPLIDGLSAGTALLGSLAGDFAQAFVAWATAQAAWVASDTPISGPLPDFGQVASTLSFAIAGIEAFGLATCASAAGLGAPFFAVWRDRPEPRTAINATLNIPYAIGAQLILKPVIEGFRTFEEQGGEFNEVVIDAFRPSANSTVATISSALGGWAGTADAIAAEYYALFLDDFLELLDFSLGNVPTLAADPPRLAATRNSIWQARKNLRVFGRNRARSTVIREPFPPLPPVFAIGSDLVEAFLTGTLLLPVNALSQWDRVFSTFDGQVVWRQDQTYDVLERAAGRVAELVRFAGGTLRGVASLFDGPGNKCDRVSTVDDLRQPGFVPSDVAICTLAVANTVLTRASRAGEFFVRWALLSLRDVSNLIIGTAYTAAYHATFHDRYILRLCDPATVRPEDVARCSLPETDQQNDLFASSLWLAYSQWYWGNRSTPLGTSGPMTGSFVTSNHPDQFPCALETCRQRPCRSNADCTDAAAPVCDAAVSQRCVVRVGPDGNGQCPPPAPGPIIPRPSVPCVVPTTITTPFGFACLPNLCNPQNGLCEILSSIDLTSPPLCACACHDNLFNVTALAAVDGVRELALAVDALCGADCAIFVDAVADGVSVAAEYALFIVDIAVHLDEIITRPTQTYRYAARVSDLLDRTDLVFSRLAQNLRNAHGVPRVTCAGPSTSFYCCLAAFIQTASDIIRLLGETVSEIVFAIIRQAGDGGSLPTTPGRFQLQQSLEDALFKGFIALNKTRDLGAQVFCLGLQVIPFTANCPGEPPKPPPCPPGICPYLAQIRARNGTCGHPASCARGTPGQQNFSKTQCVTPPGVCAEHSGFWDRSVKNSGDGFGPYSLCTAGSVASPVLCLLKFPPDAVPASISGYLAFGECKSPGLGCELFNLIDFPPFDERCLCGQDAIGQGSVRPELEPIGVFAADFVTAIPRIAGGLFLSVIDNVLDDAFPPGPSDPQSPRCPLDPRAPNVKTNEPTCVVLSVVDPLYRLSITGARALAKSVSCIIDDKFGRDLDFLVDLWEDLVFVFEEIILILVDAVVLVIAFILGFFEIIITSLAGKPTAHLWEYVFTKLEKLAVELVMAIFGEDLMCGLQDITCVFGLEFLPANTCSASENAFCDNARDGLCELQSLLCDFGFSPILSDERCGYKDSGCALSASTCSLSNVLCLTQVLLPRCGYKPPVECCNEFPARMFGCFDLCFKPESGCYQEGVTNTKKKRIAQLPSATPIAPNASRNSPIRASIQKDWNMFISHNASENAKDGDLHFAYLRLLAWELAPWRDPNQRQLHLSRAVIRHFTPLSLEPLGIDEADRGAIVQASTILEKAMAAWETRNMTRRLGALFSGCRGTCALSRFLPDPRGYADYLRTYEKALALTSTKSATTSSHISLTTTTTTQPPLFSQVAHAIRVAAMARTGAWLRGIMPAVFPANDEARIGDVFAPLDCTAGDTAQSICLNCSVVDRFINATGVALLRNAEYYGGGVSARPPGQLPPFPFGTLAVTFPDLVASHQRGIQDTLTRPEGTDTFLTQPRSIPFVLDRLRTVHWPWRWDWAGAIDPDGSIFTDADGSLPDNHAFTGTLVALQESQLAASGQTTGNRSDADVALIQFINGTSGLSSLARRSIDTAEDTAYLASSLAEANADILGRFVEQYVLCNYPDALFIVQGRGVGLFDGLVIALIAILLPAFVLSLVVPSVGSSCGSCMSVLIGVAIFLPLSLAIARAASPLCYMPTVLPIPTLIPGIPAGLGGEIYTLASESLPPCIVPASLVDETDPAASGLCGACGVPQPRYKSCAEAAGFVDGFDNIFYTLEQISPGANARLSSFISSAFPSLAEVSARYTTEAIQASGKATAMADCNYALPLRIIGPLVIVAAAAVAGVALVLGIGFSLWLLIALTAATLLVLSEVAAQLDGAVRARSPPKVKTQ